MRKVILVLVVTFGLYLASDAQTSIKMKKTGGVYSVPCTINGCKLEFIFDTGASDVTISFTEFAYMLKNGFIKKEDILGTENYRIANGDAVEGTKIMLREIKFAGLTLNNVTASVTHTLNAPLLLGQSVIGRLGKIQLDPSAATLTILTGSGNYDYSSYNLSTSNQNTFSGSNGMSSGRNIDNTTFALPNPMPDFYTRQPLFSGDVAVYSYSPILARFNTNLPDAVARAEDGMVTIIRKENPLYYYVSYKGVQGYLWVGWIKAAK